MIKITGVFIAEYASVSKQDGKTTIAGIFDNLNLTRRPDAPVGADSRVVFPACYIVILSEASISGGLTRQLRLRIVNGNGDVVLDGITIGLNFALNPQGRPMRNSAIIRLEGLTLPGADDYVIEIYEDGNPVALAEHAFFVTDVTPP